MQMAVLKGRGVSGSFFKTVVLKKKKKKKKKNANKNEKSMSKNPVSSMSICYMTMLQPTSPQL